MPRRFTSTHAEHLARVLTEADLCRRSADTCEVDAGIRWGYALAFEEELTAERDRAEIDGVHDHATDVEMAGSYMGEKRGRLWFRVAHGSAVSWRFAPIEDAAKAAELAAEINALDPADAAQRFETIYRAAMKSRRG